MKGRRARRAGSSRAALCPPPPTPGCRRLLVGKPSNGPSPTPRRAVEARHRRSTRSTQPPQCSAAQAIRHHLKRRVWKTLGAGVHTFDQRTELLDGSATRLVRRAQSVRLGSGDRCDELSAQHFWLRPNHCQDSADLACGKRSTSSIERVHLEPYRPRW
jgi:hypothetical protein